MIKFLKSLFNKKEEAAAEVPYKVETPVVEAAPVVAEVAPAKAPKAARKPRKPKTAK